MLNDRSELEESLNLLIKEALKNRNNVLKNKLKENFKDRGFNDFLPVWTQKKSLSDMSEPFIYLLTKWLYKEIENDEIKPEKYFNEVEIIDYNNYQEDVIQNTLDFPVVFKDVLKGHDDQYIMYLNIDVIKLLYDSQLISYNYETQRNPKEKIVNNELIRTANVKALSVNNISEKMNNNDFITNCITINLLQDLDGTDNYEYNIKRKELIVHSGQLNIIDGFHRIKGMIKAKGENPDLDYISEVRFTNWNVTKCRKFIFQEDFRNKIDKRYLGSIINIEKWGNKVVTQLNNSDSDIGSKIITNTSLFRNNPDRLYVMFDIMSDTIDMLWTDIKTNMDVNKLSRYLILFFDDVIGYNAYFFVEDIAKTKGESVITNPAVFVGYLTIAKRLQGEEERYKKLCNILDDIDFDINNPIWMELNVITKDLKPVLTLTRPHRKKIINYFNELMDKRGVE